MTYKPPPVALDPLAEIDMVDARLKAALAAHEYRLAMLLPAPIRPEPRGTRRQRLGTPNWT